MSDREHEQEMNRLRNDLEHAQRFARSLCMRREAAERENKELRAILYGRAPETGGAQ